MDDLRTTDREILTTLRRLAVENLIAISLMDLVCESGYCFATVHAAVQRLEKNLYLRRMRAHRRCPMCYELLDPDHRNAMIISTVRERFAEVNQ